MSSWLYLKACLQEQSKYHLMLIQVLGSKLHTSEKILIFENIFTHEWKHLKLSKYALEMALVQLEY